MRPPPLTKMRSPTSSTKLRTCSQTTMQMFLMLRISRRSRAKSLMIDGWMPSVGSSSSSTFGLLASARNRQLLLLTAGEIAAAAAGELGQDGEQFEDLLRDLALASDHEPSFDILPDRHGAENLPALRHISEAVRNALVAR